MTAFFSEEQNHLVSPVKFVQDGFVSLHIIISLWCRCVLTELFTVQLPAGWFWLFINCAEITLYVSATQTFN